MPCKYSIPVQHQARRSSSCVSRPWAAESPLFVRGLHPSFVRAHSPRCWGLCGARPSRSGRTSPLGDGGVSAGVCASHRVCPTASLRHTSRRQAVLFLLVTFLAWRVLAPHLSWVASRADRTAFVARALLRRRPPQASLVSSSLARQLACATCGRLFPCHYFLPKPFMFYKTIEV